MPTPTTPTNAVVAAVVDRLESALPALVAAKGLPAITEFLDYDPALPQPAKAPQVWVDLPEESRSEQPRMGASVGAIAQMRTVLVGVTAAGQDASLAVGHLRAYADLIRQCLEGDPTMGGEAAWAKWQRTNFSPSFAQGNHLFKEAVLTFELPRRVRRGEA